MFRKLINTLPILAIFVLVVVFHPSQVFAKSSGIKCNWIQEWSLLGHGRCLIDGNASLNPTGACSADEKTDPVECQQYVTEETCNKATLECHTSTTKEAKQANCPDGYFEPAFCERFCCKDNGHGKCEMKPGKTASDTDLLSCDFLKANAVSKDQVCAKDRNGSYIKKNGICVLDEGKRSEVFLCTQGSCDTALGNIDTTPDGFITSLLNLALPFAGFISVLAIIYVGYLVLTSQGNPEKLKVAKEVFVSVLTGLLLLIFSFAILNTIGQGFLGINSQTSSTPKKAISPRND